MEGRHVGLDFYDLLIEAIGAVAEVSARSHPNRRALDFTRKTLAGGF